MKAIRALRQPALKSEALHILRQPASRRPSVPPFFTSRIPHSQISQQQATASSHRCLHTSPRSSDRRYRNYDDYNADRRPDPRYTEKQYDTRPRYTRGPGYDPIRAQNAKPIVTTEQLRALTRSTRFRTIIVLLGSSMFVFYITHLETVPVSGRTRFNCYSEEAAEEQGVMAYQQIVAQAAQAGALVPSWDPRVRRIQKVLNRLIEGGNLGTGKIGEDFTGREVGWEVHLIEDPQQANAFVLPGGKVIVFSGILPICGGNDGLAAVLGHEIAHNIAQHATEKMSQMVLLQPIVWALIYADYTGLTFGLGRFLGSLMLDLGLLRPSSRAQESEADRIGLGLMADACFDPRQAVGLWERMEAHQKGAPPEWLSTHPSNRNRIEKIREWLPEAEERFRDKGCSVMGGYRDAFQDAITKPIVFYV